MKRVGVHCLLLAGLVACAAQVPEGTAAYREGYYYGCMEGHDTGAEPEFFGRLAEPAKHGGAPDFERGWRDGYQTCWDRALRRPTGGG